MKIIHRITVSLSDELRDRLSALGVKLPPESLATFEVEEDNAAWPEIKRLTEREHAADIVRTTFSSTELDGAHWLELIPDWHHGYPQPDEDSFGYLQATYDLSDYCEVCGIGLRQKAPFQMRGEPTWGKRGFMQLNWVFDVFFVTPFVWESVFRPLGIARERVLTPKGDTLTTVVQLLTDVSNDVVTAGLSHDTCDQCGRERFSPVTRGWFPALASRPIKPVTITNQWFGSGGSAFRSVLVSQDVRHAAATCGASGVSYRPVERKKTERSSMV